MTIVQAPVQLRGKNVLYRVRTFHESVHTGRVSVRTEYFQKLSAVTRRVELSNWFARDLAERMSAGKPTDDYSVPYVLVDYNEPLTDSGWCPIEGLFSSKWLAENPRNWWCPPHREMNTHS